MFGYNVFYDNYIMKLKGLKASLLPKPPTNNHQELFQFKLKDMLQSIHQDQISFNELMLVLAAYNIKFYSPNQFKKICRLFNNSYEAIPKHIPFSYMQLHHSYTEAHQDYHLINISSKRVELFVNDGVEAPQHGIERCLRDFIIIMKKRYGKEINWFKVIGGMTVSVTIQVETFKDNLKEILKNSRHVKCVDRLAEVFLQAEEKHIFWHKFMSVIKKHVKVLQQQLKEINQPQTIQNHQHQNKMIHIKQKCVTQAKNQPTTFDRRLSGLFQKRSSSSANPTRTNNSFYIPQQKSHKKKDDSYQFRIRSNTQAKQKFNDFMVMKKCSLHNKLTQSKLLLQQQPLVFRQTTKTSAFVSQQIDLQGKNDSKRQTFFWNYLKKKRKRAA